MGKLEKESSRRKKRADIQRIILVTISKASVMTVELLAPGVMEVMEDRGLMPKKRQPDIIKRSQSRMIERGLLLWDNRRLRLTPKGERRLRLIEARDFQFKKPKKWDGRWRVLIFDIPETRKNLRERMRATLRAVGFVRLQDSVWIFPYPCEDLVTLLKADFKIGRDMLYMIVDTLELDAPIRAKFGLK